MDTILVVDDEKVIRDGCSRLLAASGYQVLTAVNGQEALETLAAEDVNLVLCDLKMPVMGGVEVLECLNVHYPHLPLVVITGHGTVNDAVECMKKGAYDFVTKPFKADHLLLVVHRALEKQALERRTRQLQEEQARNLYDLAMEQSRLRTIINCMADGVLVTNRDLEIVLYNPSLTRVLDVHSLPPQPCILADYLPDQELLEVLTAMVGQAADETRLVSQELCRGQSYWRALSAPIPDPAKQVLGTVTVFHDITRFKELDEMKSSFVNMVSHELRSPLATIKQQLTVILEGLVGELGGKQREILERSRGKIQSLLELINELLDVARIESGQVRQNLAPLELRPLLEEVVAFHRDRAASHRIDLSLQAPPELPLIPADRRSLEEVFTNLISNAINYSPDGGQVAVKVTPQENFLEITVSDTGVGIDPEELPKIFDKFYRVKHPKTRQVIGTGLGLAIVKGVIDSHRGTIAVESEPGVGTTFRILLPTM
ncbi:MAG: response regulator [Deltaproteobacteria bacterium]|nr:response regulator [Deltaproteobacteria bacterium]